MTALPQPIDWGFVSRPNLGELDLARADDLQDLVWEPSDLERLHSQIQSARRLKPQSVVFIVGRKGAGKTTLCSALNKFHMGYEYLDVLNKVYEFRNHGISSKLVFDICKIYTSLQNIDFDEQLVTVFADIENYIGQVNSVTSDTQLTNFIIYELTHIISSKVNKARPPVTILLDGLDDLEIFEFHPVLRLVGMLAHEIRQAGLCLMISPDQRLATKNSTFRGENTDIISLSADDFLNQSTNSIIAQRLTNKTRTGYSGPSIFDIGVYDLIKTMDNKTNALNNVRKIIEYSQYGKGRQFSFDITTQILAHNSNRKEVRRIDDNITNLDTERYLLELDLRAVAKEIRSHFDQAADVDQIASALARSPALNQYQRDVDALGRGLVKSIFDFSK